MNRELIATTTISIDKKDTIVWDALVNPETIKQYMYGTETHTTWVLGSPITFTGEWQGQPYTDKGVILDINPLRVLSYSFWSPLSGTDDFEDNYTHITFHLSAFDNNTIVTITQDNLEDDEAVVKAEDNWMKVAHKMKEVIENR
jgi:uncharacterized protein YndB with AHSA1/START domain